MLKDILGVLTVVIALSFSSIVLAEETKAPVLTAVTVAVDGLHCQGCIDELQLDLGKEVGVSEIIVTLNPGQVTAKLDESKISASKLVNVIAAHPQIMDKTKTYGAKLMLYVDTDMCANDKKMCAGCFTEIPKVLKAIKGVDEVTLDDTGKIASVSFAKEPDVTTSALAKALGASDYMFHVAFTAPKPIATTK